MYFYAVTRIYCLYAQSQAKILFLGEQVMKIGRLFLFVAILTVSAVSFADPVPVTHTEFQAINSDGSSAFDQSPFQVVLEGIIINNPEEWLDPTANYNEIPYNMGGQWQLVIQGEGDDHAGTACWMGQNYGNRTGSDYYYSNEEWINELHRLNYDADTGYAFRQGDRVRVTGTYLFYGGKLNINENHMIDEDYDFNIELIDAAAGMPQPESITLGDLKNVDDSFIFDHNRLTGPEYYQARLVRIEDVNVINPASWAPASTITVQDANGLTFPVYLGIGKGISKYDCPTGKIDVVGIMNQEGAGWPPDCTSGYQILVSNYDGNGLVLGDTGNTRGNLPADINKDYIVDLQDFAELASYWIDSTDGLYINID